MFVIDRLGFAAVIPILLWTANVVLPPLPISQKLSLARGVEYERMRLDRPRPVLVHVVKIDLKQRGFELFVTPGTANGEVLARRTSSFLSEFRALVAINGGTFSPHNDDGIFDYRPRESEPARPTALAVSGGVQYAAPRDRWPVCCIEAGPKISIRESECPVGTTHALAGIRWPVQQGEIVESTRAARTDGELQPRTALALDRKGETLWMVVVDGRQLWYSMGLTQFEMAEFLKTGIGAFNALELDGGGSSTLVREGYFGPVLLNSPIHNYIPGRERPVANHLGLRVID